LTYDKKTDTQNQSRPGTEDSGNMRKCQVRMWRDMSACKADV